MTKCKSNNRTSAQNDRMIAECLFAKLSPAGRRRFFEMQLAEDFPAFVMKVFETVSSGDVFLSNWHIDAMSHAAEKVMDGEITRLIVTVPPRQSEIDHFLSGIAGVPARPRSYQAYCVYKLFK